ncbi:MAG TPA: PGPGW domain-containing protein [Acidimicrobiia bacterium]|nr:PGPGW domain-containing protein [Acidimicrobiia bacterium]
MDDRIRRPLIVRIVLVIAGTVLVIAGLIGLLLPVVPGWLLIIPGLAILATEFVWARRLLDTAKARASDLRAKVPGTRKKTEAA